LLCVRFRTAARDKEVVSVFVRFRARRFIPQSVCPCRSTLVCPRFSSNMSINVRLVTSTHFKSCQQLVSFYPMFSKHHWSQRSLHFVPTTAWKHGILWRQGTIRCDNCGCTHWFCWSITKACRTSFLWKNLISYSVGGTVENFDCTRWYGSRASPG
jgi:hypothetical protein